MSDPVNRKPDSTGEWKMDFDNLPNRLTVLRLGLVPVIVFSLSFNSKLAWLAAICFILAGITDFFDGHIARKKGLITAFGSFLDPIADKFLVVSSLIMLLSLGRVHVLIALILILREMYIISLRLLASERRLSLPVGILGKWKTGLQFVAIPLLMIQDRPLGIPLLGIGTVFIYLACFFSLYSAVEYSFGLAKKIKNKKRAKNKTS